MGNGSLFFKKKIDLIIFFRKKKMEELNQKDHIINTLIEYINNTSFFGDYENDQPVFHEAIAENEIEIVKLFLKSNHVNVLLKNSYNRNALDIAYGSKNFEMMELLVNHFYWKQDYYPIDEYHSDFTIDVIKILCYFAIGINNMELLEKFLNDYSSEKFSYNLLFREKDKEKEIEEKEKMKYEFEEDIYFCVSNKLPLKNFASNKIIILLSKYLKKLDPKFFKKNLKKELKHKE